ncbi:MAG: hypothetical protein WCE83_11970 [Candidatus Baltobacteraceae bacterium]
MQTDQEPALTVRDVCEKFPRPAGEAKEADPEIAAVALRARQLDAEVKSAKAAYESLKDRIAAFLADADTLTIDGKIVATLKRKVSKRISVELLREKAPEIAEAATVESATREFRWK